MSPSAEIVEGSSVTLSCSTDANPAANYTWYKENEDSPKASGQIFTITDFRAEHSGNYYCEVQNRIGCHNSTLQLTSMFQTWWYMYVDVCMVSDICINIGVQAVDCSEQTFFQIETTLVLKTKRLQSLISEISEHVDFTTKKSDSTWNTRSQMIKHNLNEPPDSVRLIWKRKQKLSVT